MHQVHPLNHTSGDQCVDSLRKAGHCEQKAQHASPVPVLVLSGHVRLLGQQLTLIEADESTHCRGLVGRLKMRHLQPHQAAKRPAAAAAEGLDVQRKRQRLAQATAFAPEAEQTSLPPCLLSTREPPRWVHG